MKTKYLTSFIIVFAIALFCASPATYGGIAQGSETNTKNGNNALQNNTTGVDNSAYGVQALFSNTTGTDNTGIGFQALYSNTIGTFHTAVGSQALFNSVTSTDVNGNVAVGFQAMYSDTTGDSNNAFGSLSLYSNTDGIRNVAVGTGALQNLSTGDSNTAVGNASLINSGAVNFNTGIGRRALFRTQADQNTALGFFAGSNLRDGGTNNIYIGNVGPDPIGTESNTIRIGTQTATTATIGNPPIESHPMPAHTATFIAGIFGSTTAAGVPVLVDGTGHLGTLPSSQKFKEEIRPMDKASEAILSLRPVTFCYKKEIDAKSTPQFGLVAEEVAKVNPDLVARDGNGEIYSVRYEAVNAMLLNEFIKEHRQVEEQQKQIDRLTSQLKAQAATLQKVSAQVELMKAAPQIVAEK